MKFLFLLTILLVVLAQQTIAGVLFERKSVPRGWEMGARSPANAPAKFIIALKQRNLDELERKFWAVSDPFGPEYQDFQTPDQILRMVAPEPIAEKQVTMWLRIHGIKEVKSYVDAIEVRTTVDRAEALFRTQYYAFKNLKSGRIAHKAFGAYSLPDHVHRHVSFVEGVSTFTMPRFNPKRAVKQPNQDTEIAVPQSTALFYEIPTLTPGSNAATTSQCVIEYDGEYFANSDTTTFNNLTSWSVPLIADANTVGTNDPTEPGGESTLDVQWQGSINPTSTNWFWLEDDADTWLYGFSIHFLNTTTVPQVISTSYGWWEGDQCDIDSTECSSLGVDSAGYVERVNAEFQKIGLLGVSQLVASGDSGANGRTNGDCSVPQLRPAFPASSPYVTSVGATEIRSPVYSLKNAPSICSGQGFACVSNGTEAAVSYANSYYASGGGFSNISVRPSYQDSAVATYFSSGVTLPPSSYYNASGRGVPDVAALGQNGFIVIGGDSTAESGTSLASPIFSGIASLLNAEAIKLSGKPLGFLNPLLYSIAASTPAAFHDITLGDNICTEDGCGTTCKGYYATKGWDPVTGLGTPNYANLLTAVQGVFAKRKLMGL